MGCLPGHLISHHYWEGACPGPPRTARCPQPPSQGDTEARRVQPGRPSAGPSGAGRSRSAHAHGHTQREPWTLPCTIKHHEPSCPQPLKLPGALGQRDPYTGLDGGRVAWQPTRGPSGTPPASQEGEQSGPGAQRRRAEEGGPQRSVLLGKPWACEPRPCPPGLVNHAPPHTHCTLLLQRGPHSRTDGAGLLSHLPLPGLLECSSAPSDPVASGRACSAVLVKTPQPLASASLRHRTGTSTRLQRGFASRGDAVAIRGGDGRGTKVRAGS